MSFRCEKCDTAYPSAEDPGQFSPTRLVVETRSYIGYPAKEIAREVSVCRACAVTYGDPKHTVIQE